MAKDERDYKQQAAESFLLRLWLATGATGAVEQRVMLRSVITGESIYFSSLAALVAFLQAPPVSHVEEEDGGMMNN
ncbi:MAG: hypothetical protein KC423_27110 [Anaerolineales bacterium]|nr:hypothetical protein [Anaerolineales bacterium]MCB9433500.1 hypothetical protein [Ardenticatenaceae bacterium]